MTFQICKMNGTDFKSDLLWQRRSIIFEARLQMERETEKISQRDDKIVKILTPGRLFFKEMRKDSMKKLLSIWQSFKDMIVNSNQKVLQVTLPIQKVFM